MANFNDFVKELNSMLQTTESAPSVGALTTETVLNTAPKNEVINTVSNAVSNAEMSGRPMKILIVSTHVNQVNGYSKVVHNIIQQLSGLPWLKVVHFGTQKIMNGDIGRTMPSNVKVIDGSALEKNKQTGFAFAEVVGVINSEKPDVVFIYNDISVVCAYIEEIRKNIQNRAFKIWAYLDTCYQPQPQAMLDIVNRDVERIFCLTRGWKAALKAQGVTRPVDVLPHGIDSKMIRSLPRELARQTLGLPKDVFLFVSINKNIPRKRLDLLVMAFVKLILRFPTKPIFLLIVSDKGDRGGYQLFDIFAREIRLGGGSIDMLGNRLLVTAKDTCYKDDDINILNNCADAGVSCAEGEGFGLCSFDQMAVGVPQIVPELGGYTEYCTDANSLLVKPKMRVYNPQAYNVVCGEAQLVDPEDVAKAMERYVFDEDLRKLHGGRAKESVLAYTWEKSCATLIKRLNALREEDD